MSLHCVEGREAIKGTFHFVYFLVTVSTGLQYDIYDEGHKSPPSNGAICLRHSDILPPEQKHSRPEFIEGFVYGMSEGWGLPKTDGPFAGNIRSDVTGHFGDYTYLGDETLKTYLPKLWSFLTESRLYLEFPHLSLGLKENRIVYDAVSSRPLFMLSGVSLEDRTKYLVIPFKKTGDLDHLHHEFVSIDQVAEKIQNGRYGVYSRAKSRELRLADYHAALKKFEKRFNTKIIEPENN